MAATPSLCHQNATFNTGNLPNTCTNQDRSFLSKELPIDEHQVAGAPRLNCHYFTKKAEKDIKKKESVVVVVVVCSGSESKADSALNASFVYLPLLRLPPCPLQFNAAKRRYQRRKQSKEGMRGLGSSQ